MSSPAEWNREIRISIGLLVFLIGGVFVFTKTYSEIVTLERRMDKRYDREVEKIEKMEQEIEEQHNRIEQLEKDIIRLDDE